MGGLTANRFRKWRLIRRGYFSEVGAYSRIYGKLRGRTTTYFSVQPSPIYQGPANTSNTSEFLVLRCFLYEGDGALAL